MGILRKPVCILIMVLYYASGSYAEDLVHSPMNSQTATFYIVGAHGYIERWSEAECVAHSQMTGISMKQNVCRQAALSPSGDRLAVSTYGVSPIRILNAENLQEDDLADISLDLVSTEFALYMPTGLCFPNSRYVLVTDEAFLTRSNHPFSAAVIDLNDRLAVPLRSTGPILDLPGKTSSPPSNSNELYVVDSSALTVIDLETRSTKHCVQFSLEGWSELLQIQFDWDSKYLTLVTVIHHEDTTRTLRLEINLDTLRVSKAETVNPWTSYRVEESSRLGQLVRTYHRGYQEPNGKHDALPLIDTRLDLALKYLTEESLSTLPFSPEGMHLSSDGRWMVCTRTDSEPVDNSRFSRFLSQWVLVDLVSGKQSAEGEYPEEITCVSFEP